MNPSSSTPTPAGEAALVRLADSLQAAIEWAEAAGNTPTAVQLLAVKVAAVRRYRAIVALRERTRHANP